MTEHEAFMGVALAEARQALEEGEQPFGAVIVRQGRIVAQAHSCKVGASDSTAHGELLAVRMATQSLGERSLTGATLYTTCEPCSMCAGAIFNAGIRDLVVGARLRDLDDSAFHTGSYSVEAFAGMMGWELSLTSGVCEPECVALYNSSDVALSR